MNYDSMDFEMDDWEEDGEDEVLYESDEFREQNSPIERHQEPIISDDLPVLPLRGVVIYPMTVSYTHLRAHETVLDLVCRILLEKK